MIQVSWSEPEAKVYEIYRGKPYSPVVKRRSRLRRFINWLFHGA